VPVDALEDEEGEGAQDIEPYRSRNAIYVYSTTVLPRFQGRGFGRILKAYFLGAMSHAGFEIAIGHAREGRSFRLNKEFGAQFGAVHPNWYDTGEAYHFYTMPLR
jgi:GNAT superfamily N-acetyltransferase